MRVLYFAAEYYCNYGARTHARCFFGELARDPRVSHAAIFPADPALELGEPPPQTFRLGQAVSRDSRRLREAARRRLPHWLEDQLDLYDPSPPTYAALAAALARDRYDAAVLRLGPRFRYIGRVRREHPRLAICAECNSTPFDEDWRGIPGERSWRREHARQLGKADCVSVVSDYLRRYFVSIRPSLEDSIFINPNGADPAVFQTPAPHTRGTVRGRLGIPGDALVLGYVGGLEEWRRLPELVSWVARARGAGLDRLFLVLIGAGRDLHRVLKTIDDSSTELSGSVYCSESWLALSEVPAMMAAFDVGLLSFQYQHCCQQKAFEYLLTGLPVIGPAGSFPHGLLSDAYGTFAFDHDFAGFLATLRHVQDDLDSCKVAARRGRELVAAEFTWKANAGRVLDALEKALS